MGKKRRKNKKPETAPVGLDGLEHPFPCSPSRPPRVVLYCRYPHDAKQGEGRRFVWTFGALYSARRFVDEIIGDGKFKWKRRNVIVTARGVEIRVLEEDDGLELVMDHELSDAEAAWIIPEPKASELRSFLRPFDAPGTIAETPRTARAQPVRTSRDGLVTVAQLCARLDIEPRDGRAILRRAKVAQPPAGWAWPPDEAAKIEKILAKAS